MYKHLLNRSDAEALRFDWQIVAQDLWKGIADIREEVVEREAIQGRLPLDVS